MTQTRHFSRHCFSTCTRWIKPCILFVLFLLFSFSLLRPSTSLLLVTNIGLEYRSTLWLVVGLALYVTSCEFEHFLIIPFISVHFPSALRTTINHLFERSNFQEIWKAYLKKVDLKLKNMQYCIRNFLEKRTINKP